MNLKTLGFYLKLKANKLDSYDQTCEFLDTMRHFADQNVLTPGSTFASKMTNAWYTTFTVVAYNLGIKDTHAIDYLFNNMVVYNNWNHLHPNKEEESRKLNERFNTFFYDVLYCSDRWSFDRLMRTHWLYNEVMDASIHDYTTRNNIRASAHVVTKQTPKKSEYTQI